MGLNETSYIPEVNPNNNNHKVVILRCGIQVWFNKSADGCYVRGPMVGRR
ncbi:hypothetical protein DFP90_10797 [Aestuariispira insulae]|uniref:Uncharacterized protein n=1 Tax=Aestuariispira insulae TaxID=1461337 RepID=A0A3D9HGJ5_9PROT|nr:hypothetical protein DFP90_10797 [Aestuariispira insulae]